MHINRLHSISFAVARYAMEFTMAQQNKRIFVNSLSRLNRNASNARRKTNKQHGFWYWCALLQSTFDRMCKERAIKITKRKNKPIPNSDENVHELIFLFEWANKTQKNQQPNASTVKMCWRLADTRYMHNNFVRIFSLSPDWFQCSLPALFTACTIYLDCIMNLNHVDFVTAITVTATLLPCQHYLRLVNWCPLNAFFKCI